MEIEKIQTAAELAAVQKANIANQTENIKTPEKSPLLSSETDADSEIINRESVQTLTSKNSNNLIRNSEGTTFVVIGNTGCGRCKS